MSSTSTSSLSLCDVHSQDEVPEVGPNSIRTLNESRSVSGIGFERQLGESCTESESRIFSLFDQYGEVCRNVVVVLMAADFED